MKKYFCKYLPIEGEIKEGDLYYNQIYKTTQPRSEGTDDKSYIECQKVKLFLCSRDIQVGDTVKHCKEDGDFIILGQGGNNLNEDPKNWLNVLCSNDKNFCGWDLFKVIGQISPNALSFVKEGDEFEEGQISTSVFRITSEILPNSEWVFIELLVNIFTKKIIYEK